MSSNKLKQQFLAILSHELRTPLYGALGNIEQLEKDRQHPSALEDTRSSLNALGSLLDRILHFTDLSSGRFVLYPETKPIEPWLQKLCQKWQEKSRISGINFSFTVEAPEKLTAKIDYSIMQRAVDEVIDNAFRFSQGTAVHVSSQATMDTLRIQVVDAGNGIPEDVINRLFEEFEQADQSSSRRVGGLGLGLSLAKSWLQQLGGELSIQRQGQQTHIDIRIPLHEGNVEALPVNPVEQPYVDLPLEGKLVLIVEDNAINQRLLVAMVKKLGGESLCAEHGKQALSTLQAKPNQVDLILMDCHMPVMDGYQTTQAIRASAETWSALPIIAVTANAMSEDRALCLAAGMNEYIAKPVTKAALVRAIQLVIK